MSVWSFKAWIGKAFSNKDSESLNQGVIEAEMNKRLHPRYAFGDLGCTLSINQQKIRVKISNLSYSGVGLEMPFGNEALDFPDLIVGSLSVLGADVSFSATKVFQKEGILGLSFLHRETSVLLFIREILEFCRFGTSVRIIDRAMVRLHFSEPDWIVGRGEGPSDFQMKVSKDGNTVEEAAWSYLDSKGAHRIFFDGKMFFEGALGSDDSEGSTGVGRNLPEASFELLRLFAFFLVGLPKEFPSVAVSHILAAIERNCPTPVHKPLKLA